MRDPFDRQLQDEGTDWLYCAFGGVIIAVIVLAATAGHAWVSAGVP